MLTMRNIVGLRHWGFQLVSSCLLLLCSTRISTNAWQQAQQLTGPARLQRRHFQCLTICCGSSSSRSGDHDPVLRLPLMEAELATLDNDKDPSELKMAIGDAKTAAEFGVRRAQLEFYDAFSRGDIDAMERVWSTQSHVRCVHPGMSSIEGREAVMDSWRQIFSSGGGGEKNNFAIEPSRAQIEICGLTAICSCIEETEGGGELEALNIYKREAGNWRMTLHMAGPVIMQRRRDAFF